MKKNPLFLLMSLSMSLALLASCGKGAESSSSGESSSSSQSSSSQSSSSSEYDVESYYDGYYKSLVSWNDGADLKRQLHDLIRGGSYQPIDYKTSSGSNWSSNSCADQDLFDHEYLDVVYSGSSTWKGDTTTAWQREHAFPATLMTGSPTGKAVDFLGRATDFHNLFASSSSGNTSRGNKNYGMANKEDSTYKAFLDAAGDGYSYDRKNFEPSDHDKGRLSRAIFYMGVMYSEDEMDTKNNILMKGLTIQEEYVDYSQSETEPYTAFAIGNKSTLLKWAARPVDLEEYQHNVSVYSYVPNLHSDPSRNHAQGNRNPFVDYPGLIDYVYGDKASEAGTLSSLRPSVVDLEVESQYFYYYAIKEAKRTYEADESFSLGDVSVLKIGPKLVEEETDAFTVEGIAEGEKFAKIGPNTIKIRTEDNTISYVVNVVETDPLAGATWSHKLGSAAAGGEFNPYKEKAGIDNEITMDGLDWIFRFETGKIGSMDASKGLGFGSGTVSVGTLTFMTKEAFAFDGKSLVDAVYFKGAPAAKKVIEVEMWISETKIYEGTIGSSTESIGEAVLLSGAPSEPMEGIVKIVVTPTSTSAVYVHSLGINAHA